MSYFGSPNVFSYPAMRQAEADVGQELLGGIVRDTMLRINNATDGIRRAVASLRGDLDGIMTAVESNGGVRQMGHQAPADLAEAVKARELGFTFLADLLGPDKVREYLAMSKKEGE